VKKEKKRQKGKKKRETRKKKKIGKDNLDILQPQSNR
jgi:hypothetical protein